jgi:hypothetical protein
MTNVTGPSGSKWKLTRVELSMISLINVMQTVVLLPRSNVEATYSHTYARRNDVAAIATQLRRMPNASMVAIFRTTLGSLSTDLKYRPHIAMEVLDHLRQTNDLYKDIPLVYSEEFLRQAAAQDEVDAPTINIDDENLDAVPFVQQATSPPPDIFLHEDSETTSLIDQIEEIVREQQVNNQAASNAQPHVIISDQNNAEFVDAQSDIHFDQKAFPLLYPCGTRGGPNNPYTRSEGGAQFKMNDDYIQLRLRQGYTRDFQTNNSWIFYHYSQKMKKRIG